jgi:hypothetical protein
VGLIRVRGTDLLPQFRKSGFAKLKAQARYLDLVPTLPLFLNIKIKTSCNNVGVVYRSSSKYAEIQICKLLIWICHLKKL